MSRRISGGGPRRPSRLWPQCFSAVAAAPIEAVAAASVGAVLLSYQGAWFGLDHSSCQAVAKIQTEAVFWPIVYIRTFRSPFALSSFSLHATSCILAALLSTKLVCSPANLLSPCP